MAKFFGRVGYGTQTETAPGVFEDVITERQYYGDVVRDSRQLSEGEHIHGDVNVGSQISIMADAYANDHIFAMKYVEWAGVLWTVSNVEVQRPRLLLSLGEVYNGPTPAVE
jgi:hypothetical protein